MASSMKPHIRTYVASGAINAYSFVKFDSGSNAKQPTVVQCGAGDRPIGIAQNDANAASGDEVEVARPGGGGLLKISGTIALGNFIKSDGSGYGVATANAGDAYGAQADEGGAANDVIGVMVSIGEKYNASA
jgi:hypothetical protein